MNTNSVNITTGNEYTVDPDSIRFDESMVSFNRVHDEIEYESTKLSIVSLGQQTPISINDKTGLCENGRHRTKICKELGIPVKCIQVKANIPRETRLEVYNMDETSGRDLNTAQKAVQAHKFAMQTGCSLEIAAKKYKTNDRAISAANTIAGLGRHDILEQIHITGEWIKPDGKKTKNLRAIASILKMEKEEIEDTSRTNSNFDYESLIHTERGKSEFWSRKTLATMSDHELSMIIIKSLNYDYQLKVNQETGEII